MDEASRIPYRAADLTAGRILVLAAHPDDETLGAGGTISLNRGVEALRIWIATDGTSQEGVPPGEEAAYGLLRREEARRAAAALGAPEPRFAGFPDRGLARIPRELDAALSTLIDDFEPQLVLCPSPVEIHPDHRALAEALFSRVASSRPADADHDRYRLLRVAFYEISHPLLPNQLVDVASEAAAKKNALGAYASQQGVRDYAGAIEGLNAYRRMTLSGAGPVEAFRVVPYAELASVSLESFRRSIGPTAASAVRAGPVPVSLMIRTRNRPALLQEALDSVRDQTARPRQVVVINDGGAALPDLGRFREAFELVVEELSPGVGRSAAANRGVARATEELVAFLDDDDLLAPDHFDRLHRAYREGPSPVVYSDAVTAVYSPGESGWKLRHRGLQYSLDFDADYLLLANYIPLHTLLMPRSLYLAAGGFDEQFDLSEDWDFLIRLSFQTVFRHVRAVTCEYRVFEEESDHVAAGAAAFQEAREKIYARYSSRRTDAAIARAFDRMRSQVAFWYERDWRTQGELVFLREGQVRWERASHEARELRVRNVEIETDRARLRAENELVHARLADVFAVNERYDGELSKAHMELGRLESILDQIYASRTWKLHLLLERLRGRR